MAAQLEIVSSESDSPIRSYEIFSVDIARVRAHPRNPRGPHFDTGDLEASLAELGQLSPIAVTRVEGGWQVHHGNRRVTAARRLGWTSLDAYELRDEGDEIIAMVVENVHEPIPPTRMAEAMQYARRLGWTTERAGRAFGLAPDKAALVASLLNPNIPQSVRDALDAKRLTLSQYQHLPRRAPANVIEAIVDAASTDEGGITVERIRRATRAARESGDAPAPQRIAAADAGTSADPVARVNAARQALAEVLAARDSLTPIERARVEHALAAVRGLLK